MKKEMLINVLQPEEIRIAIVEDGVLEELYVERTSHESYVGNIYKGRIVNIEPSIQAAFVDFGVGRNGFLHVSDVEPAYYRHLEGPSAGRREDRDREDRGDRDRDRDRDRGGRRGGRGGRSQPSYGAREEPARPRPPYPDEFEEPLPTLPADSLAEPAPAEEPGAAAAPGGSSEPRTGFGAGIFDEDFPPPAEPRAPADAPPPAAAEWEDRVEDAVAETEAPAAAEEEVAEEKEPRGRGRRRTTKGKSPRKPRGEKTKKEAARGEAAADEAATPPDQEPAPPGEDRPRLMDSSERRTDENDPPLPPLEPRPAPDVSDDELSFSRHRREESDRPAEPAPADDADEIEPAPRVEAIEERFEEEESFEDVESVEPAAAAADEFPAVETPVIDFDEDYEPDFEEAEDEPRRRSEGRGDRGERGERRERGGRGRDDRRGPRGRRPMGRPGAGRPKPPIQEIFKRGQEVLVQVIKEGIGTKGPTLSTYISIAGRYLVLMPGLNRVGVSRKIDDDETRRRLREILNELHPPKGLGFIIRTAGQDRNKKELQRDLAYLSRLWEVVVRRIRKSKSPCEIYEESDMVTRTIRDIFTGDIDTIWVDEPAAYEAAREFLTIVMPRYADRIKLWDSNEPMFHKYGIEQEITRIQQRHVPLPHGGSIVIDQTEALVAIDVNSGNFRADNNAEETAYRMNLQAAKEIARQLRLRDLGGVIVNDFIDMREEKHNRAVERALREAMQRDRARTKILRMSQFGIIEMTRQRIRPSLKRSVYQDCTHCRGTGQVKTVESMSIEVMRLLQLAVHRPNVQRIDVQVHDLVAQYLLNRKRKELYRLEEQNSKAIAVRSAGMAVPPEHLEFFCYDNNNNEVKFMPYEEPRLPVRRRSR